MLLERVKEVPTVHQSYAVVALIEEASESYEQSLDITNHLKVIKLFLDSGLPVNTTILQAAIKTNNPQIKELIQSGSTTLKPEPTPSPTPTPQTNLLTKQQNLSQQNLSNPTFETISNEDLKIIILEQASKDPASITAINMAGKDLGDQGAITISTLLVALSNPNTTLDLEDNAIRDNGAIAIATAIEHNAVASLNLDHNEITDLGMTPIIEAIEVSNSLLDFNIANNNFAEQTIQNLSVVLGLNDSMVKLNLSGNNLGDDGAAAMSLALDTNESIAHLNLGDNNIGDKGLESLSRALEINFAVSKISLEANNVSDSGIKFLARVLESNHSITDLDLGLNEIGAKGIEILAASLKDNHSVINLNIGGNNIGDDGAKSIIELLKVNYNLVQINISYNNIVTEGLKDDIKSLIDRNQKLQQQLVDFASNGNLKELQKLYQSNPNLNFNQRSKAHQIEILKAAIASDKVEIVKFFFAQGFIANHEIANYAKDHLAVNEAKSVTREVLTNSKRIFDLTRVKELEDLVSARALDDSQIKLTRAERAESAKLDKKTTTNVIEAIRSNKAITVINLKNSTIDINEAKSLATIIKDSRAITTLNLANSNMTTGPIAVAIIESLKDSKSISEVNLSNSNIRDEGAKSLAEVIKVNHSITNIKLAGNSISSPGVTAISGSMLGNYNIIAIDTLGTNASQRLKDDLAKILKRNQEIQSQLLNIAASGDVAALEAFYASEPAINFANRAPSHQKAVLRVAISNNHVAVVRFFINQGFSFDKEILKYAKEEFKQLRIASKKQDSATKKILLAPKEEIIKLIENAEILFAGLGNAAIADSAVIQSLDIATKDITAKTTTQDQVTTTISSSNYADNQIIKELLSAISQSEAEIFLSYCWQQYDSTVGMVDSFDNLLLNAKVNVCRDKRGMSELKTQVRSFMKHARHAIFVSFINRGYLKSDNCLYEVRQALKGDTAKIFPIIYKGDKVDNIFDIKVFLDYVSYWQERCEILGEHLKKVNLDSAEGLIIQKEINKLNKNKEAIAKFIDIVRKEIGLNIKAIDQESAIKLLTAMVRYIDDSKLKRAEEETTDLSIYLKSVTAAIEPRIDYIARNIRDQGVRKIFDFLEAVKLTNRILEINLASNNIGNDGAKIIARILKQDQVIKIDLTNNKIKSEGAKEIAKIIKDNKSLTKLNLSKNYLESEGTKAIAESLRGNDYLVELNLSSNKITDNGAISIAEVLAGDNISITTLNLGNNAISDEGAVKIAKMLETNNTITRIDLSDNDISDKGARIIIDALKKNKVIISLNLAGNDEVSSDLIAELGNKMEQNLRRRLRSDEQSPPALNDNQSFANQLTASLDKAGKEIKTGLEVGSLVNDAAQGRVLPKTEVVAVRKAAVISGNSTSRAVAGVTARVATIAAAAPRIATAKTAAAPRAVVIGANVATRTQGGSLSRTTTAGSAVASASAKKHVVRDGLGK